MYRLHAAGWRGTCPTAGTTNHTGNKKKEHPCPFPIQFIARLGACGKTGVLSQNCRAPAMGQEALSAIGPRTDVEPLVGLAVQLRRWWRQAGILSGVSL
jgi:hypothetical protein